MSVWSNNFAPELFETYADWYVNFVETLHKEPSEAALAIAREYFSED